MATGGVETMRLDCPICKKKMTQPTAFECLHFFCQPCVDDMKPNKEGENKDGYKCPICDEVTIVDKTPIMDHLSKLLGETDKQQTGSIKCDTCGNNPVTERCLDCKEFFCETCKKQHNGFSALKNHKWEPLGDATKTVIDQNVSCPDHDHKNITLYCKSCDKPICVTCIEETHGEHSVGSIKSALDEMLPKLNEERESLEKVIGVKEEMLAQSISHAEDIKKGYEELEKSLEDKYNDVLTTVRKDYQTAKSKLEEIRDKQRDQEESFIKDIELQIKSAKNNVALTNAVIRGAEGASLLCTLHSKLRDRLNKSRKEHVSELDAMKPIQAKVEFNTTPFANWAETDQVTNTSGEKPKDYLELKTYTARLIYTNKGCRRLKLAQIENKIWDVMRHQNIIQIGPADQLRDSGFRTLTLDCSDIRSLVQFGSKVLVATSDGLHDFDVNGKRQQLVAEGAFCDVVLKDGRIYAVHQASRTIKIITYDEVSDIFTNHKSININDYKGNIKNTIHATADAIFIAFWASNRIDKYTHDGVFNYSIGTEGDQIRQFKGPRICGSDKEGNLLIADCNNNRFQVLTPTGEFHAWNIADVEKPLCAAFVGNNFWIVDDCRRIQCFALE